MRIQILIALMPVSALASSLGDTDLSINYGITSVNQTSINSVIAQYNSALALTAKPITSSGRMNVALDYYVFKNIGIGMSYTRNGGWVESSRGTVSGRVSTSSQLFMARLPIGFAPRSSLNLYVCPSFGGGSFWTEALASGSIVSITQSGSGTALVGALSAGARYFVSFIGLGLEAGYQRAASRSLAVEAADNPKYLGTEMKLDGVNPTKLDMSGPYISGTVTIRLNIPWSDKGTTETTVQ